MALDLPSLTNTVVPSVGFPDWGPLRRSPVCFSVPAGLEGRRWIRRAGQGKAGPMARALLGMKPFEMRVRRRTEVEEPGTGV